MTTTRWRGFCFKCTLEYPQRLAGKTLPLPELNLSERPELKKEDLAAHVRLWGQWVLENARRDLASYYPVIDDKPTVRLPLGANDSVPRFKRMWRDGAVAQDPLGW